MKFEEALYCQIQRYIIGDKVKIDGKKIPVSESEINWMGIYCDGFQVDRN
jgi:hypothetical protein